MFLNRTGKSSNLTAFSSKIQTFCGSDWTNGGPHENEFGQFPNAVPKQIGLKMQMKKLGY